MKAFLAAARRALPRNRHAPVYLRSLERRLAALGALAAGGASPDLGVSAGERSSAAALLRAVEGVWHDGDENRVRDVLDAWAPPGSDPVRTVAARLLGLAEDLARPGVRPETISFFLWAFESTLAALGADVVPDKRETSILESGVLSGRHGGRRLRDG